jgi:hypothetical protein
MSAPVGGVSFTEEMRGWVSFGEADYERGYADGRRDDHELMFHLTISVDAVERFASDPERRGTAVGWVGCHAIGGRLTVERGEFNLLVDSGEPGVRNMRYRLFFRDGVGRPLTLSGFKVIRTGGLLDVWPDTSTLYTRVLRGHVGRGEEEAAELVASGILRIRKRDFARQLTTFRAPEAAEVVRFGRLFARDLWPHYRSLRGRRT